MRIQGLGEWMEHDCVCPSCLKDKIEAAWKDGEPSFDDEFKNGNGLAWRPNPTPLWYADHHHEPQGGSSTTLN